MSRTAEQCSFDRFVLRLACGNILFPSLQTSQQIVYFPQVYVYVKLVIYLCSQVVAREKLDKMREANESKTRKELEMTITDLKVSSVCLVNQLHVGPVTSAGKCVIIWEGGKTRN